MQGSNLKLSYHGARNAGNFMVTSQDKKGNGPTYVWSMNDNEYDDPELDGAEELSEEDDGEERESSAAAAARAPASQPLPSLHCLCLSSHYPILTVLVSARLRTADDDPEAARPLLALQGKTVSQFRALPAAGRTELLEALKKNKDLKAAIVNPVAEIFQVPDSVKKKEEKIDYIFKLPCFNKE